MIVGAVIATATDVAVVVAVVVVVVVVVAAAAAVDLRPDKMQRSVTEKVLRTTIQTMCFGEKIG